MPKVSVIVPVYNVENYIRKCLDSIISQTLKDIEIILVDDGSEDNSGKICDEYAEKDSRIIVIHQKNNGLSNARNTGLNIASGEYIGFVDSDDYIKSEMYSEMYQTAEKTDADMVLCNYSYDTNGNITENKNFMVCLEKYIKKRFIS